MSNYKLANLTVFFFFFFFFFFLLALFVNGERPKVRGMFVFGSSLVDNGNNNFFKNSTAKANYEPYGIDFPEGPTGRFSNGKNLVDILGDLIGLPLVPPFADPSTKGNRIMHGVNFASGGSGILDQTGSLAGERFSMNQQINNFATVTLPQLKSLLQARHKNQRLSEHFLSRYLFIVGTGGNDYLLNYLWNNTANQTPQQFTTFLVSTLKDQLNELYNLGARKFVLFSVQAMGCYPVVTAMNNGRCIDKLNNLSLLFNSQLRSLANSSKEEMPASRLVFVDSYKIISDIIDNPLQNGFSETSKPCCELTPNEEGGNGISCRTNGPTCENRAAHVFFDGLHPTEAVNIKIAEKAYASDYDDEVYPTNVEKMVFP